MNVLFDISFLGLLSHSIERWLLIVTQVEGIMLKYYNY